MFGSRKQIKFTFCSQRGVLPAFTLGVALRGLYLSANLNEYTSVPWYWVPEYILFFILSGVTISLTIRFLHWEKIEQSLWLYSITVGIFIIGCVYLIHDNQGIQKTNAISYDSAIWVSQNIPNEKLFAMYDSGTLSYFSTRDVIPLNGLITDRETMEKLLDGKYFEVMNQFDVDYLVTYVDKKVSLPPHLIIYQSQTFPPPPLVRIKS